MLYISALQKHLCFFHKQRAMIKKTLNELIARTSMLEEFEKIDIKNWERKEIYEMFSNVSYPFYSITTEIDVTKIKRLSKEKNISFYHYMVWLCTKAINFVPQFRIRIRENKLIRLKQTNPSFTFMKERAEQFQIATIRWEEDLLSFCKSAKAQCDNQNVFCRHELETDALIYFSCTPWFDFTALTNEHNLNPDDTIPRITWGKYYEDGNNVKVHLSVEVNHRLIDGYHIGKMIEMLENLIDEQ